MLLSILQAGSVYFGAIAMIDRVAGTTASASYESAYLLRVGVQASTRKNARASDGAETDSQSRTQASTQNSSRTNELTAEEQRQVDELTKIDRRVRQHEAAHMAAGGNLVRGGASYSYTTGPDNKRYAVAGEVSIDTSPGRTPEETIPKAQRIQAAALAPADPSAQDRSVAASSARMAAGARIEVQTQRREAAAEDRSSGAASDLYRGVQQAGNDNGRVGGRLDLFA